MSNRKLLTLLFVLLHASHGLANKNSYTQNLLDSLDRVLAQREVIMAKKQSVINDLKRGLRDITVPEQKALKYEQIYTEYLHFSADSAIVYAKLAVKQAIQTGNVRLITSARFCLLRAYSRQGLMGQAYRVISEIGPIEQVLPEFKPQYADMMIDFVMRLVFDNSFDFVTNFDKAEAWKTYSPYLDKGSWEYHFYRSVCIWQFDIPQVERLLSSTPQPSFQVANLYLVLALGYKHRGDTDKFYQNLILSAINDALLANQEVSSLLFLLDTPLLEADLDRSYRYAQVCAENVIAYHDVQRALKVVEVQRRINQQFNARQSRQVTAIVVVAVLFFLALVVSIIESRLVVLRERKVKQALVDLEEAHSVQAELTQRQEQLLEQLSQANGRLTSRAHAYRNDFVDVYRLVTSYIAYTKTMRTELLNLLKTNSYRKALQVVSSNTIVEDQLKMLNTRFDHSFLNMYPDFVARINTLIKPESRFDETVSELSTSLRIYALVVLGNTDSVGIADFLHLSSQTVYNYRLRMRRLSAVGEKAFDDRVASLYAPVESEEG